jgi:uncharacterized protein (DUF488 family)
VANEILTIGHSTHPIDRFLSLLSTNRAGVLADVRRYPGSRRNPQFNSGALAVTLEEAGISYVALGDELGGRRSPNAGSVNTAWEVEAFRGYADHMDSPGFAAGLEHLENLARDRRTAVMCAEADWRRCHRRLIADALTAAGWRVMHVGADGAVRQHTLTPFALVDEGRVTYPPAQGTLTD